MVLTVKKGQLCKLSGTTARRAKLVSEHASEARQSVLSSTSTPSRKVSGS